jgi:hypothetical protein
MKLQRQNRDDLDEIKVMVQKILQVIDHPELKGLLNKLGGSMETSTSTSTATLSSASASGSNTEVGVTQGEVLGNYWFLVFFIPYMIYI